MKDAIVTTKMIFLFLLVMFGGVIIGYTVFNHINPWLGFLAFGVSEILFINLFVNQAKKLNK